MKIIITGADGMLGSNLVRLLLERGHQVSAFLHPQTKSKTLEGLPIKTFTGDILQPETLLPAFDGHDAVIHAAASTAVWPARSEKVRKINIEGTRNVVEAVLEMQIPKLIYVGSASSVNTQPKPSDKYPFPGAKFGLDYIDSKYEAYQLVMDFVRERGLPALAILPTFMIGAYDSLPGTGKMILSLASGKLNFYTRGGRNIIHVRDVATAIANSLEKGETGKYYIAGNENITYKDFFARVGAAIGKPYPTRAVPSWAVKLAGLAGDLSGMILRKEPLLTYPMARIACEEQYVDSTETVRALGMPQTDISLAVKESYQWFLDNHYL
ncbi:MAG: NAD-dependent epimerase/dehydratase family protein [Bacteroides sp.]|nr:NAD-dependent epimerase/dehydratase family protein [Bacteroides sp.]